MNKISKVILSFVLASLTACGGGAPNTDFSSPIFDNPTIEPLPKPYNNKDSGNGENTNKNNDSENDNENTNGENSGNTDTVDTNPENQNTGTETNNENKEVITPPEPIEPEKPKVYVENDFIPNKEYVYGDTINEYTYDENGKVIGYTLYMLWSFTGNYKGDTFNPKDECWNAFVTPGADFHYASEGYFEDNFIQNHQYNIGDKVIEKQYDKNGDLIKTIEYTNKYPYKGVAFNFRNSYYWDITEKPAHIEESPLDIIDIENATRVETSYDPEKEKLENGDDAYKVGDYVTKKYYDENSDLIKISAFYYKYNGNNEKIKTKYYWDGPYDVTSVFTSIYNNPNNLTEPQELKRLELKPCDGTCNWLGKSKLIYGVSFTGSRPYYEDHSNFPDFFKDKNKYYFYTIYGDVGYGGNIAYLTKNNGKLNIAESIFDYSEEYYKKDYQGKYNSYSVLREIDYKDPEKASDGILYYISEKDKIDDSNTKHVRLDRNTNQILGIRTAGYFPTADEDGNTYHSINESDTVFSKYNDENGAHKVSDSFSPYLFLVTTGITNDEGRTYNARKYIVNNEYRYLKSQNVAIVAKKVERTDEIEGATPKKESWMELSSYLIPNEEYESVSSTIYNYINDNKKNIFEGNTDAYVSYCDKNTSVCKNTLKQGNVKLAISQHGVEDINLHFDNWYDINVRKDKDNPSSKWYVGFSAPWEVDGLIKYKNNDDKLNEYAYPILKDDVNFDIKVEKDNNDKKYFNIISDIRNITDTNKKYLEYTAAYGIGYEGDNNRLLIYGGMYAGDTGKRISSDKHLSRDE